MSPSEAFGSDRGRDGSGFIRTARAFATGLTAVALVLFGAEGLSAQGTGQVSGTVTNAQTGQPMSGAQVSIRGLQTGALTGEDGSYSIRGVPTGTHTLVVRLIGFGQRTRQIEVTSGQTTTADFDLREQAIEMEGIVVTGTAGGARRREIGNTITQINAEEVQDVPTQQVTDLMQGRISGATILENSGQVGAGSTIRIRGNNSLTSNDPLIYVDGQRIDNSSSGAFEDEANQSVGFLDNLNPQSIERIEVVKGPSATTLYGTEASGGVIQIFTKSGSGVEGARWNLQVRQGMNVLPRVGPEEDPTELHMNCGVEETEIPGCPDRGSYDRPGHSQNYSLSVRGGASGINYYLSGSGALENGVLPTQGQDRWGIRGNFGFQPASSLNIQFNNLVTSREVSWVPDGNNAEGFLLNVFRGEDGYTPNNNDMEIFDMELTSNVTNVTSGVNVTWNPTSEITQSLKAGIDYNAQQYEEFKPYGYWSTARGNRESDEFVSRVLSLDYTGTWSTDFGDSFSSRFSWGGQLFHNYERSLNGFGEFFAGPGDKLIEDAAQTEIFGEDLLTIVEGGAFFQEQIGWNDQLFVTAGLRIDGNSTFGEDFGAELYPKIQGSYMLSDNAFWPEWWGTMKLRAAVGRSGTAPGPFDKLRTWSSVGVAGEPGVTPSNIGNETLGPEVTREMEGGFDATFADERVDLQFTYYDQETSDALVGVQPIPSSGFIGSQLTNVGTITNSGVETNLGINVVRGENLSWRVGGSFSTNNSEAIELGLEESVDVGWRQEVAVGHPVPVMVQERVRNPDAAWSEAEFNSDSIIGPTMPTHNWSANTDLTVQRLTFRATGSYEGGHYLSSGTAYQNVRRGEWPGQPPGASATCTEIQQRAAEGNTDGLTALDRALCDTNDTSYGMWTWPSDFFSLRSVSLSYEVPQTVLPLGFEAARFTVAGRNLLKITDYPGVDPEAFEDGSTGSLYRQEYYNLPPLRSFTATLNLNW